MVYGVFYEWLTVTVYSHLVYQPFRLLLNAIG